MFRQIWQKIDELPWRERPKVKANRAYLLKILGVVGCMGGIWLGAHIVIAMALSRQMLINQALVTKSPPYMQDCPEIERMIHAKERLSNKYNAVTVLQQHDSTIALLDECAQLVPTGVQLTHFSRINDDIQIHGMVYGQSALSLLIRRLESSKVMVHPQLISIQTDKENHQHSQNHETSWQTFELRALSHPISSRDKK